MFEDQNHAMQASISKTKKELDKAISDMDSEKVFELSNKLGISYSDNDPLHRIYDEGYAWHIVKENKQRRMDAKSLEGLLSNDIAKKYGGFSSKQERIDSFLKRGNSYVGVFDNYKDIEMQANILATHFPGKFNSQGRFTKGTRKESPREIKTIYEILYESPGKVSEMYNNTYKFYLNQKKLNKNKDYR